MIANPEYWNDQVGKKAYLRNGLIVTLLRAYDHDPKLDNWITFKTSNSKVRIAFGHISPSNCGRDDGYDIERILL